VEKPSLLETDGPMLKTLNPLSYPFPDARTLPNTRLATCSQLRELVGLVFNNKSRGQHRLFELPPPLLDQGVRVNSDEEGFVYTVAYLPRRYSRGDDQQDRR
jgi:hypothetical protein